MRAKNSRIAVICGLLVAALLVGIDRSALAQQADPQLAAATETAAQAWMYAYPMLMNYRTMWLQMQDPKQPNYIGRFNVFRHYSRLFTPLDNAVVTPNNDTPYSWAWLDLRSEPLVLSLPQVPDDRYYVVQCVDLFTYNYGYLGTRTTGNKAGKYLLVGPNWKGSAPSSIEKVVRCDTQFALLLMRVQLKSPGDMEGVRQVQQGVGVYTLSRFLATDTPRQAPPIDWPKWDPDQALSVDFIAYLNFLLQLVEPDSSEKQLLTRFATIGIGPGLDFDPRTVEPRRLTALEKGVAEAKARLAKLESTTVSSMDLFGNRAFLKNDYNRRAVAAAMGLYGNSKEEAVYTGAATDASGQPLDCSKHQYVLRFPAGKLPPAKYFWSVTMYDLPSRFLVANPIDRYSLGSTSPGLKTADDGSLSIYLQTAPPPDEQKSNWLPAPFGRFNIVLRIYGPESEVLDGTWKIPPVEVTHNIVMQSPEGAFAGYPTLEAAREAQIDTDYSRALQAYRFWYPAVSMEGVMSGARSAGARDNETFIFLSASPKQTVFTANSDTPYGGGAIDLRKSGPIVIEIPPGPYVGVVDNHFQDWVMDLGLVGPDAGKGGKHVVLPPGSQQTVPEGYFVARSPTYRNYVAMRALPLGGDSQKALDSLAQIKMYPLNQAANPPAIRYVNGSDLPSNVSCLAWEDNLKFWEHLHEVINEEPLYEPYAPMYGLLRSLGIEKGATFSPSPRMKSILEHAAKAGRNQMLVSAFASARPDRIVWKNRQWEWVGLVADNGGFATPSGLDLEARDRWFIQAILTSPAMFRRKVGAGSLYWLGLRDASGAYLDGSKTYKLTVPQPVPAILFWSVTAYDAQTRSQVQTVQNKAALRSLMDKFKPNADGSVDLYFGPSAPVGFEGQWIQTAPGRGWFSYFRIYGPLAAAFDGTWQPGDFQLVK